MGLVECSSIDKLAFQAGAISSLEIWASLRGRIVPVSHDDVDLAGPAIMLRFGCDVDLTMPFYLGDPARHCRFMVMVIRSAFSIRTDASCSAKTRWAPATSKVQPLGYWVRGT